MQTYMTRGTCSRQILFDVNENNQVKNVKFIGGCSGNLQAVARLVDGKDIDEVISVLKGIKCRSNTSCGDQLALALEEYKERKNSPELDKKRK
ncbi:MAG: TIGR03905 family TSCPD domain-containing protein [Clostridia bacterium]|nr:TIGR03905 family TSCPD domain-containing protein [Clostridia bacterium]